MSMPIANVGDFRQAFIAVVISDGSPRQRAS
jgi:hypothetical protein